MTHEHPMAGTAESQGFDQFVADLREQGVLEPRDPDRDFDVAVYTDDGLVILANMLTVLAMQTAEDAYGVSVRSQLVGRVEGSPQQVAATALHMGSRELSQAIAEFLVLASTRVCRECGCTDAQACETMGPDAQVTHCYWVDDDLCSTCVKPGLEVATR